MSKLKTTDFHLPYNPDLVFRAKEMRKNPTLAEQKLWKECLRNSKFRFLRQRPVDQFIVDFYCAALRLVIEVDGSSHFTEVGEAYDRERTQILESYGLRVMRFTNREVIEAFDSVCCLIEQVISQSASE